jgi:hypothetical protein
MSTGKPLERAHPASSYPSLYHKQSKPATPKSREKEAHPLLTYHQVLDYTTRDNIYTLRFGFLYTIYGWRTYILTPIDYSGHPDDSQTTHRYFDDENGLFFICWHPLPTTIEEMQSVVSMWSEFTCAYINTGETMDSQYVRLRGGM